MNAHTISVACFKACCLFLKHGEHDNKVACKAVIRQVSNNSWAISWEANWFLVYPSTVCFLKMALIHFLIIISFYLKLKEQLKAWNGMLLKKDIRVSKIVPYNSPVKSWDIFFGPFISVYLLWNQSLAVFGDCSDSSLPNSINHMKLFKPQ